MFPLSAWFDAMRFSADVQSVIGLRLMRIAAGGPGAAQEAHLMVAEKIAAAGEAHGAAFIALATGASPTTAAKRAHSRIHRTVRANKRRLSR